MTQPHRCLGLLPLETERRLQLERDLQHIFDAAGLGRREHPQRVSEALGLVGDP